MTMVGNRAGGSEGYFIIGQEGREVLAPDVMQLQGEDRIIAILLIAVFSGLDRTEAAINNSFTDPGAIITGMNQFMREAIK